MNEILQIIWDKEIILFIYLLNQLSMSYLFIAASESD